MTVELAHTLRPGDTAEPTLVLLHGMGSVAAVWDPLLAVADWAGPVLTVDLRGHGRSPWSTHYSFGALAADVAALLEPDADVVLFGHSMGGVVALTLASGWFRVSARAVMTCGIKTRWADEELAAAAGVAAKPPRRFDDEDGARTWALRLAGLWDLAEAGTIDGRAMSDGAIRRDGDAWIAGHDPRALAIGPPPMAALHRALAERPGGPVPALHTVGALDQMTGLDQLTGWGAPTDEFAGAGHNAVAEVPDAVWSRFRHFLAAGS